MTASPERPGSATSCPVWSDVYEYVSPHMKQRVLQALQTRWETSITELTDAPAPRKPCTQGRGRASDLRK
ncbi:MAG: hypothetical protein JWN52_2108 [Actinomycetia bacterium]|nr:hypothetical protein [Actinomycetes bacterium]